MDFFMRLLLEVARLILWPVGTRKLYKLLQNQKLTTTVGPLIGADDQEASQQNAHQTGSHWPSACLPSYGLVADEAIPLMARKLGHSSKARQKLTHGCGVM